MPQEQYPVQEVTNAEVTEVRMRDQFPGQRRAFNYVVRLSTQHPDTGEALWTNEYRTYASDRQLSTQTVLDRMIELVERAIEE